VNLYFDTNVYSFIAAHGEADAVRRLLKDCKHRVQASASNLFEVWGITDRKAQALELKTLTAVASSFEERPQSWLHAQEVRREVGRCRPSWLKAASFTKTERHLLKGHTKLWGYAKAHRLHPGHAHAWEAYRRDFEPGVASGREFQKSLKEFKRRGTTTFNLLIEGQTETPRTDLDLNDPEMYWRASSLMVWHSALAIRTPASRDYADWLSPYVKEDAFSEPTYFEFWLEDVKAENVPRNRLMGLVRYYQLRRKITHGNARDQLHANHLLDADVFFTADQAFYACLVEVVEKHLVGPARPILLNRSAQSALGELSGALGGQLSKRSPD
jgi:hypothetical protein